MIARNVLWLACAQAINLLLPVAVLPYLLRRLGPADFGAYILCQATVAMAMIVADWGFNLTATQRIAASVEDPKIITATFSDVITAKFILGLIVTLALIAVSEVVPNLRRNQQILMASAPLLWGAVLFPQWLFQGLQRMGLLTICLLGARLVTIALTFCLVHGPPDTWLAALINASGLLLAGLVAVPMIVRLRLAGWRTPSAGSVLAALGDGWHVFLSSLATSLYAAANSVILGALASTGEVGLFAISDKIRTIFQMPIVPLSSAAFPQMGRLASTDSQGALRLSTKLLLAMVMVTLPGTILLYVFALQLVRIVAGPGYDGAADILKIFSPVPVIIAFNTVFGVQLMLPFGLKRSFSRILIGGAGLNLILMFVLVPSFGARGAAIAVVATEAIVTISMGVWLWIYRPWRRHGGKHGAGPIVDGEA